MLTNLWNTKFHLQHRDQCTGTHTHTQHISVVAKLTHTYTTHTAVRNNLMRKRQRQHEQTDLHTENEMSELNSEACVWRSISFTRQINPFSEHLSVNEIVDRTNISKPTTMANEVKENREWEKATTMMMQNNTRAPESPENWCVLRLLYRSSIRRWTNETAIKREETPIIMNRLQTTNTEHKSTATTMSRKIQFHFTIPIQFTCTQLPFLQLYRRLAGSLSFNAAAISQLILQLQQIFYVFIVASATYPFRLF